MVIIKDVMSKDVITIEKEKTIFDAISIMCSKNISCLVIIENEKVVGIITRHDILEKVILEKIEPENAFVKDFMTTPVITLNENGTLIAASGIMNSKKIKQIPIVSDDNTLSGIITQTDIVINVNSLIGFYKQNY
jgi:CBS domain-containing protein